MEITIHRGDTLLWCGHRDDMVLEEGINLDTGEREIYMCCPACSDYIHDNRPYVEFRFRAIESTREHKFNGVPYREYRADGGFSSATTDPSAAL